MTRYRRSIAEAVELQRMRMQQRWREYLQFLKAVKRANKYRPHLQDSSIEARRDAAEERAEKMRARDAELTVTIPKKEARADKIAEEFGVSRSTVWRHLK
jgi:transcriptional regulator of acetoin/glycerol metabolism